MALDEASVPREGKSDKVGAPPSVPALPLKAEQLEAWMKALAKTTIEVDPMALFGAATTYASFASADKATKARLETAIRGLVAIIARVTKPEVTGRETAATTTPGRDSSSVRATASEKLENVMRGLAAIVRDKSAPVKLINALAKIAPSDQKDTAAKKKAPSARKARSRRTPKS